MCLTHPQSSKLVVRSLKLMGSYFSPPLTAMQNLSGLNSEFLSHQRDANAANLLTSSISTLLIMLALLAKPLQHDL
jgi:hypothetical protein